MIKYFIITVFCFAENLIYLTDNEGFLLNGLDNFVNSYPNFQSTSLINNNSIISSIGEHSINNNNTLVSKKYIQFQGINTIEVLYLIESYLFKFEQISFQNPQKLQVKHQNQIFIDSINSFNITLLLQDYQCFDHLYIIQENILLLICQKQQLQSMDLIFSKISFSNKVSDYEILHTDILYNECEFKLASSGNQIYLITCLGTYEWSVYQIMLKSYNITLLIDKNYLINQNALVQGQFFKNLTVCNEQIILYNDQLYMQIRLDNIQINIEYIDKIIKIQDQCYLFSQDKLYILHLNNEKQLQSQIYLKPLYLIGLNNQQNHYQQSVNYLLINNKLILYNNTHLFIDNQYKQLEIQDIYIWNDEMITIYQNHKFLFYQLLPELNVLYINNDFHMKNPLNNEIIEFLKFNSEQTYFISQKKKVPVTQAGLYNTFIKLQYPIYNLTYNTKGYNLQPIICIQRYNKTIANELLKIQNKELLMVTITQNIQQLWIARVNNTLELIICITEIQDQNNLVQLQNIYLMQIDQLYNVSWYLSKNYHSMKSNGIFYLIIQNSQNYNITVYQLIQESDYLQCNLLLQFQSSNKQILGMTYIDSQNYYFYTNHSYYYGSLQIEEKFNHSNSVLFRNGIISIQNQKTLVIADIKINLINNYLTFEDGIKYENIFKFENDQFLLIYQTFSDLTLIQHYYVSQYNSIILLKNLPFPNCTLLYPYRIKSNQPKYFSIEAFDELTQQNVILLYDISYPLLYCLRYKTILKSNQYILSEDGHIVFIYENEIEFIIDDELRIQQNLSTFDKRKSIHQLIQIKQENLFLTQTLSIKLEYLNNIQTISLSQNQITIEYQQNQQIYELPIQQISEGEIHQVEFEETSQTNYQLIKPIEVLFNQNCDTNIILQLNSTHYLVKYQYSSGLMISIFEYKFNLAQQQIVRNKLDTIIVEDCSFIQAFLFDFGGINYSVIVAQEKSNQINLNSYQYVLKIYQLHESKLKYFQTISIDKKANNIIFKLSNNRLIARIGQSWIIYELIFQVDQIIIEEIGQIPYQTKLRYYQQNGLIYFYQVYKNQIEVYQINEKSKYTFLQNITYSEGTIYDVQFLEISKTTIKMLINYSSNQILFLRIENGRNYYVYLAQNKIGILTKSILLKDLIFIPYSSNNSNNYSVFSIINQESYEIVYPIQQLQQQSTQHYYFLDDYLILSQDSLGRIEIIRIANEYQINIQEFREQHLNLILSNQLGHEIIRMNIVKKKKNVNYIWMIIFSGCILIINLMFLQNNIRRKNYREM